MKCEVCNKHKAKYKDYRFIDGYFNGKILVCKWCFDLNDVSLVEIFNNKLNPESYHDENDMGENSTTSHNFNEH